MPLWSDHGSFSGSSNRPSRYLRQIQILALGPGTLLDSTIDTSGSIVELVALQAFPEGRPWPELLLLTAEPIL